MTIGELKEVQSGDTTAEDLALAAQAKAEHEASQTKKKEPWEIRMEQDHPELIEEEPKKEEPKQTEKPKEEPEKPSEEKSEPVEKNKEEVKEEKKDEPPKKEEPPQVNEEEEIRNYALKEGITLNDAREEIQKVKTISEKYKNDPKELARALRHTQSGYDKIRVERDSLKQEYEQLKQRPVAPVSPEVEVRAHIEQNRDNIIEAYRQKFPARTREMEDDAIVEEVFDKTLTGYTNWQKEQMSVVKQQATSRREELLNSLSDADKQFLPDIKVVLDKTTDTHILNKSFSLQDIIYWAKGQHLERLVKEAEERATKRALEQPRIIAEVAKTPQVSSGKEKTKQSVPSTKLTDFQKKRALEMYEGTSLTDEEKFEEYSSLLQKEVKKKEK